MLTALWIVNTMPVNDTATSATPSDRTPMTSISCTTRRKYFGGSARLRGTRPVRQPAAPHPTRAAGRPPAHALDLGHDEAEVLRREREAPEDAARQQADAPVPDRRAPQVGLHVRYSVAKLSTSRRQSARHASNPAGGAASTRS